MKKILLCPFFGDMPIWIDKFQFPNGYEYIIDTNLELFKKRVKDKLGIDYPGIYGSGKVWDYRPALGLLYEEEIKGYDYWLTCDFDMVFGDVDKWFTDEQLNELDIWSNHHSYVCGCWTLYRNCKKVNELFMRYDNWKEMMIYPEANGWVEKEYSRLLEESELSYRYSFYQGNPYTTEPKLKKEGNRLYQDEEEIAMFHFRRSKIFPL